MGASEQESRSFGGSLPPKCHFYGAPSPAAGNVQSDPPANSTSRMPPVPCQDLPKLISRPKSAARAPRLLSRAQFGMEGPGWRKIPRVTQRRPTLSRRGRVLRVAPCMLRLACRPTWVSRGRRRPTAIGGLRHAGRVPWRATPTCLRRGAPQARLQAPRSRIVRITNGRRAHGT